VKRLRAKRGVLFEVVLIALAAIGLSLAVQAWAVKPYQIPSASMEPTLTVGQRVVVNRIGTHFGEPEIGDILVFMPPLGAEDGVCGAETPAGEPCSVHVNAQGEEPFIKRVVAGPGDRLRILDGRPIVNGVAAQESFARPCREDPHCDFPEEITIPHGQFFMMGDNRPSSEDSRSWGPIPEEWIIGRAFATYWPPDRIGTF